MTIFLFAMGVSCHGHFPFCNGRELSWPLFFSTFFHNRLELSAHCPFCNGLELPAQVYPLQLFTSLRSLKLFHSLFSFLALFLLPIACRNSAALSDFFSGLPFSSTHSSFRNGLYLPAHLLGRRSPVFDLADCMFVLGRIAWIFRSHIIYDIPIIAHHRHSELHLPCSTSGQGLDASGFRMGVDGLLQALLVVRGGPEQF